MGRKRKGSVIGDIGKMFVNTIASPFEALTGQNFVDFKYTSDFGKGASKVVEPLTKGISGAMMAMGTTALNAVAPGAGTALSGMGQGLGQGMKQNSIQQPPMQKSNKTRPTSGINSVPYGVQEGMPKTGYRNGGPMDSKDLNRFIKSSIAANRGKNFVDRIVDPYAPSTNVMGVPATHYMSSAEVDGRNIVYPNVVQRGSGNQLQHLSPEEAIDYALKTGEFMEFGTPEEANNFATNYKQEMTRKFKHGGMLKAYNAPTHENGGQMIDANANPTNNPNKAVGEIEKKETSWNGYVFSDTLGEGKKTFAQMSKEIVNRYKGKRDNLSKKTMEKELSLLVQKNEAARLEKEQMEMQQQQMDQEAMMQQQMMQQGQQGQPSQEQMMQMMQQQQMQQQGQPSEEEMMMMQQMMQQQQGGMPQEGMPQDMGQYRWGGNMDVPMYQYQNGGMLEVPEAPLDEYKKGGWIQKVTKSIKKRGTEGVCTGDKFGGPSCPPGSKRYNLAKTFKAMAKKEDGGYIDSFPDLNLANYEDGGMMEEYKDGGMIKRADGSYSQRGLWDNIRDNIGSGKKPTKEMLEQEAKIKAKEYGDGGYVVTRSNDRKGKTHKVTGPDGTIKYFGDPDLKNNPSEKAKDAFYARHKKNLEGNPHFRAYARATWRDGGMIPEYADGGNPPETPSLQEIAALGKMYNEMYNIAQAQQYKQPMPFSGNLVGQQRAPAPMTPVTLPEQQYRTPMDYRGPVPNVAAITEMSNPFASPAATTTNAPNYTPLNQQFPVGTPTPNPYAQMLSDVVRGAANMVAQNYALPEITRGKGIEQTPQEYTSRLGNLPIPIPSTQESMQSVFRNMPGGVQDMNELPIGVVSPYFKIQQTSVPLGNEIPSSTAPEAIIQRHPFELQMEEAARNPIPPVALNPYANQTPPPTTPETPVQEEGPFKLRPLEYATIGLKGAALGKSIYDALQPAEKEQLRLNREAGLVNNMMAGRNVNMAAALNEALYNRNAALASNQARSANVQRALDMQTYSNTERNAIRSKLEEQNMNNQLRMQEAQVRAELGASEAAERIRRQNVQSMNEAARRAFGQKAFQDLSTIGGELNKVQVYRDMFANKKSLFENQFRESLALLKATGGKYGLFTDNADQILSKLTSGQSLTPEEYNTAVKMIEAAKQ